MSGVAVLEPFTDAGWETERKFQQDIAWFLSWCYGWSVDLEVRVPGVGRADLVVVEDGVLTVVEVKASPSVGELVAAGGQALAYRQGLGAERAAVAVSGEDWAVHGIVDPCFSQMDVWLWLCSPLYGDCDDIHFFEPELQAV